MTTEQSQSRTIVLKIPAFKSRHLSSTSYILALLLFLMPFINIKCNDKSFASITGKDLVTGYDTKKAFANPFGLNTPGEDRVSREHKTDEKKADDDIFSDDKELKGISKPNLLAVGALICCLIAIVCSFIKNKIVAIAAAINGTIACLLLAVVFFDLFPRMNNMQGEVYYLSISVSFSFWFYLCVLLLGAGAYCSFQVYREAAGREAAAKMQEYASQFNYNADHANHLDNLAEE